MPDHPSFAASEHGAFLRSVRTQADAYFSGRGLSTKANGTMVAKAIAMILLTFVPYGLILSGRFSGQWMAFFAFLTGLGMAGIGFSIGHDALHGSFAGRARVNRALGWSMDLVGGSSYFWRITHNVMHHTYTNIYGADDDVGVSPLLRLSPNAPRRWFHRSQHLYAIPLYSLTTLFWAFLKDYQYLFRRNLEIFAGRRPRGWDLAGLFIGKIVFYTWSIVIPLAVLPIPWWQTLVGILIAHLTAGTTLGLIFQLAHVVEQTAHPRPDASGRLPVDWAAHEMMTTANFAPGNRILGLYIAGLNQQVEHHIFPRVCSIHYPALHAIVQDAARCHGLPYNVHTTFGAALASHLRTLRRLGSAA